ncbi:hypothetical protein shim_11710 [Shimia sp. SK013]|uniref:DUF6902 family protein n=1 Tax=Shimia sp. SK013 TaxID=1389006 RepID=UPI0006B67C5D|nr:hypothetical protein [Shimia sp. SK013]KPA22881.1 hypothetical protein shim_11710 [Shimia sp. SK013]
MSNVITLAVPKRQILETSTSARLAQVFASERRGENDVFWLKENAEFLNVLQSTGQDAKDTLALYDQFYETIETRIEFFPQYYRFLLSICLDIEDLRGQGDTSEKLVRWVQTEGLALAELSDLQRMEARRLMARRGVHCSKVDDGLDMRARTFMSRTAQFALPNKKIAYELTHTVFYLSDYGTRDPELTPEAMTSLEFVGLWAFVEQNADLLSEICVAMRFGGKAPPQDWLAWLHGHTGRFDFDPGMSVVASDNYHEFLMCQWAGMIAGNVDGFTAAPPPGVVPVFQSPQAGFAPLRELSESLYGMHERRTADWSTMRPAIWADLSPEARDQVARAEASSACFETFFEYFSRVSLLLRVAS